MKNLLFFSFLLPAIISLKAQNVGIGTNQPMARLHVVDSSVLFTGPSVLFLNTPFSPPASGAGGRMMWYPAKGAFRVGIVTGPNWDKDSIGFYSFASGYDSKASGESSIAMGEFATASQLFAIAIGRYATATNFSSVSLGEKNTASGAFSLSTGILSQAKGEISASFGYATQARAYSSVSMGQYNDTLDNPIRNEPHLEDRIFQLGNGVETDRRNAITILRNGNMGIGTTLPKEKLVVSGKIKTTSLQITNGAANGNILTSDANGNANWAAPLAVPNFWTANGNNIYNNNAGNVGIGLNPAYKLHIGSSNNGLRIEGPATFGSGGTALNIGGAGDIIVDANGIVGGRFVVKENGYTGIGKPLPTSTLDVNGSLATKVQYKTGSSGAINLDHTATIWIFNSNISANIILPTASDCPNRRYTITNRNNAAITISSYFSLSNTVVNTIPAFSSIELVSGGASWEQIK